MTYISRQELFNNAWNGFVKQGWKRSVKHWRDGYTSCQYRGENDCRCGIGWSIPDDKYHPKMEGLRATAEDVASVVGIDVEDWANDDAFANALQNVHDSATDATLEQFMRQFAAKFNLAIPGE